MPPPATASPLTAVVYFVIIFALLSVSAFLHQSPTFDEPVHLFAGYSYLKTGDFRANPEHPPLVKMWAALPLLAYSLKDFRNYPQWDRITENPIVPTLESAREALFVDGDAEWLFFIGKLPMLAITVLLGIFVSLWAAKLFGRAAGAVGVAVFGLDPNILAHSAVIHTDIPFAAFFFIGTYFFWRYLREASLPAGILSVLCFALGAITKYSAPSMLIVWLVLGAVWVFSADTAGDSRRWGRAGRIAGLLGAAILTAYVAIWAAYGLRYDAVPGGLKPFHFEWLLKGDGSLIDSVGRFAVRRHLLPEAWLFGQLYVLTTLRRPAYLLGHISPEGFWSYFPVAFLAKTPLPALILIAAGLWLLYRSPLQRVDKSFLIVPPAVYFLLAVFSRINIGLRHILPIYPFLFVLIAGTVVGLWARRAYLERTGLALLGVWYLAATIWIYPHYLAYFNEAAGGPDNGYRILNDSNLDWGQDLKGLKLWMERERVKKILFVPFGICDPEYYGIDAAYLPGTWILFDPPATQSPEPFRYVAVSPSVLYSPYIIGPPAKVAFVNQFKSKTPVAKIGYSIFIYENG